MNVLKSRRIALGWTLYSFCRKNGFDPCRYSRVERGASTEKDELYKYAKALLIENPSYEETPINILDKLPVLLQTTSNLDDLLEKIKESQ